MEFSKNQHNFRQTICLISIHTGRGCGGGGTPLSVGKFPLVYLENLAHEWNFSVTPVFEFFFIGHWKWKTLFNWLIIGTGGNSSDCLILVRKAVLFQSYHKWWMVGRWMERNANYDFYCVLFISDFKRTHHFHFLMFPIEKDPKKDPGGKVQ